MNPGKKWYRTFLIIFSGQAFSLLGSSAVNFALVWWLTSKTGSASILAYASIAAILPQAVISPFAGPFIDRWSRRATMIVADLTIAATSVVLLALFSLTTPPVAAIMAIIAVRSAGAAFHTPASQAAVPMYVPSEHLMQVAGWNFFLASGVAMAGPVLGALLMTAASIGMVMAIDIAGAAIAVASLLAVSIPHPQRQEGTPETMNFAKEFLEGWRELVHHRGLFHLTLTIAVVTLLYMPLNALFPLMTFSHFRGDAAAASYVEVGFGAGMLIGSLGIGALSSRLSAVGIIGGGILVLGALLGISGLLPVSGFWIFVVLCVLMGVSVPAFSAPLTALFQGSIDPAKLGRVMSLYTTLALLVAPVGLLVAGPLAEVTGVAHWFAISGAMIAATGLVLWMVPSIRAVNVKPTHAQSVDTGHAD